MGFEFRDWLACPSCGQREDLSTLAHGTDIVFECYECGLVSEFVIGEDICLQNLDLEAIMDEAEEQPSD